MAQGVKAVVAVRPHQPRGGSRSPGEGVTSTLSSSKSRDAARAPNLPVSLVQAKGSGSSPPHTAPQGGSREDQEPGSQG